MASPSSKNSKSFPTGADGNAQSNNIVVGVRVRSFRPSEPRELAVRMSGKTCQVTSEDKGSQKFTFDHCFWSNEIPDEGVRYSDQEDVFQQLGKPLVERTLEGYNCCLIAFGPTGSGKTYSMFGPIGDDETPLDSMVPSPRAAASPRLKGAPQRSKAQGDNTKSKGPKSVLDDSSDEDSDVAARMKAGGSNIRSSNNSDDDDDKSSDTTGYKGRGAAASSHDARDNSSHAKSIPPGEEGIIPRVVNELFSKGGPSIVSATCSIVEIYMDDVYDLVGEGRNEVAIRSDGKKGFQLVGASQVPVSTFAEMQEVLRRANKKKTVQATSKNIHSSRAHTVVQLAFLFREPAERTVRIAFADLAGSERVKDTKSEGITLEQAKHINLSLLSLGKCVEAAARLGPDANANDILHFKDTSLTKVLKDYIGGNTMTSLLVTIAPGASELHHTLQALRFGDRAKHITTHATISTSLPQAVAVNNVLSTAVNAPGTTGGVADVIMTADGGNGGRVYLFRQTKEYLAAQLNIRMLSLQKREAHIRTSYLSDEMHEFTALQKYLGKELSRMKAHHAKEELHKLPVLLRLRRAMAIVEPTGVHVNSAPPALLVEDTSIKNMKPGESGAPPLRPNGRRNYDGASGVERTTSLPPLPRVARLAPPALPPRSNSQDSGRKRQDQEPQPPTLPPLPPGRGRPRVFAGEKETGSKEKGASSNNSVVPLPVIRSEAMSKYADSPRVLNRKPLYEPPPPKKSATEQKQSADEQQQRRKLLVAEPPAAAREKSPKKSPLEKRMSVTDAQIMSRDVSEAKKEQLIAERQFFSTEFMKRMTVETDQHAMWKKMMKQHHAVVPEAPVSSKRSPPPQLKKAPSAAASRVTAASNVSPPKEDMITPDESPAYFGSPQQPASLDISPNNDATRHDISPTASGVAPSRDAAISPSFHQVSTTRLARQQHDVTPPLTEDHGSSEDEDGTWVLRNDKGSVNRVQSARTRAALAAATAAPVVAPTPPAAPRPEVVFQRTPEASPMKMSLSREVVASLREDERAKRRPVSDAEEFEMKELLVMAALDATFRVHKIVTEHLEDHVALKSIITPWLLSLLTATAYDDRREYRQMRALSEAASSPAVFQLQAVSFQWILMSMEHASRVMLATKEEELFHSFVRECGKITGRPSLGSLLTFIRDDVSILRFEMDRGLAVLRGFSLPSDEQALESSLEPERVEINSILLPASCVSQADKQQLLGHRVSVCPDGIARPRKRTVSFSQPAEELLVVPSKAIASSPQSSKHNRPGDYDIEEVISSDLTPSSSNNGESDGEKPTTIADRVSPVNSTPSNSPRSSSSSSSSSSASRSPTPSHCTADDPSYFPKVISNRDLLEHSMDILKYLDQLDDLQNTITKQNSRGTFTDEEHQVVTEQQVAIARVKQEMAREIRREYTTRVVVTSDADDEDIQQDKVARFSDFFNDLILSTDIDPNNLELVRSLVDAWRQRRVFPLSIDLLRLSESRGLLAAACTDSSIGYLKCMLNLYKIPPSEGFWHESCDAPPDVDFDFNEVSCCAMYNQLHRIPLVLTLLQYTLVHKDEYPSLHAAFVTAAQDMTHEWNEFLSDICNAKKAIPKENRQDRDNLVRLILMQPRDVLPIDAMDEGADDQTRLSRAAKDGEAGLLQLMTECLSPEDLRELVLRVQPDKTTCLIQAVLGGKKEAAELVCKLLHDYLLAGDAKRVRDIVHHKCEEGSAKDLVRMLNRDVAIEIAIDKLLGML